VLHERKEKQGLIHKTTPSLQEVAYNKEDEKKLVCARLFTHIYIRHLVNSNNVLRLVLQAFFSLRPFSVTGSSPPIFDAAWKNGATHCDPHYLFLVPRLPHVR